MEILLLTDIQHVGKKGDLLNAARGFAMNHLLPSGFAIVATPQVRKQYASQIKKRAEERDQERAMQASMKDALSNKVLHISASAAKNGKLYAAITEKMLAEALQKEYSIAVDAHSFVLPQHLKTIGMHTVAVKIGAETATLAVEVKAEGESKKEEKAA
jgi:large subunit ribosomal protein L9